MKMDGLNFKNFSYFAFNPEAPVLSKQEKRIIILAHVLFSLTAGLAHTITAIIYCVKKKDFETKILEHDLNTHPDYHFGLDKILPLIKKIEALDPLNRFEVVCRVDYTNDTSKGIVLQNKSLKTLQDLGVELNGAAYYLK